MSPDLEFESVVARYYEPLYRFAFSLARTESEACDLTQQAFYVWATKRDQLRDATKVKAWLFTTLHRIYLEICRKQTRFPHQELDEIVLESMVLAPLATSQMDCSCVLQALRCLDEVYQAPVALFYLEDYSYKQIAEILEIPIGTVKSRLARGIGQLQLALARDRKSEGTSE
jgi:RNA polymerase sigma-70 factor, ECF subfamily